MRKIAALLVIGALASQAAAASQAPIEVIDDQPSIIIPLAKYDLARADDVVKIRHRIRSSAMTVCDRTYRGLGYLEDIACFKTAISDANSQLDTLLARRSAGLAVSAITVTAPTH